MKYSDLLLVLSGMTPSDLDRPVLVTLGNDQDEIAPIEGVQRLERDAAGRMGEQEGTLLLRLT